MPRAGIEGARIRLQLQLVLPLLPWPRPCLLQPCGKLACSRALLASSFQLSRQPVSLSRQLSLLLLHRLSQRLELRGRGQLGRGIRRGAAQAPAMQSYAASPGARGAGRQPSRPPGERRSAAALSAPCPLSRAATPPAAPQAPARQPPPGAPRPARLPGCRPPSWRHPGRSAAPGTGPSGSQPPAGGRRHRQGAATQSQGAGVGATEVRRPMDAVAG